MTLRLVAALVPVLCTLAATAPAPAAAPGAAGAGAHEEHVFVVMRTQAQLPTGSGLTVRERRLAVVRALKSAVSGQRDLLALLAVRKRQGLVSSYRSFWVTNAVEVVAAAGVVDEIAARADVAAVRPDTIVAAPPAPTGAGATADGMSVEPNIELTNAPQLWTRGVTGQGIVVASLDTGVDKTHADLASRWRGGSNSWYDPNGEHPTTPTDVSGHGTWVTGVMVGGDAGGSAIGMAPGAQWIAAKIFNDRGTTTTTKIHAAFQWLLDPDHNAATDDAPDVVNSSWTMSGSCNLEFEPDIQSVRAAAILPVFAAGNAGPMSGSASSPADNPGALSVGDVDNTSLIDDGSSRGPSACSPAPFPDVVAPGVGIRTSDLYGLYTAQTGTSLAAPHVSGALALMLSGTPGAAAANADAAVEATAADLGDTGPDDVYGFGRIDAAAGYDWLTTAPDFTLSAGPSSATAAPSETASYQVSASAVSGFTGDVALSLSGLTAGQASWSFGPPTIAGGTGASLLSVSTAASLAPGKYTLTITATSGSLTHSATVTLVVPDFSLATSPTSQTTTPGTAVTYSVSVGAINGFTGTVALSLSGLSQGTWSFTPGSVSGSGGSQLTVTPAAAGTYSLTVTGTSGSITHTRTVTLVVNSPADFGLSATPVSASVAAGRSMEYTVTVSSVGGFAGSVSLSVSGLPSGATASFSSNPVTAPRTVTLTVRTTRLTPRGTRTVTITGRSGTLAHTAGVTLAVI